MSSTSEHPGATAARRRPMPARGSAAVALGLAAALLAASGATFAADAPDGAVDDGADPIRPDIIVIMVDDLAYIRDESILRRLPTIDRLFRRGGLRFMRAYNEVPLCCPARANFHGGQHTLKNGVTANNPRGFDHTRTLATALDAVGYETQLVGKYLNNYDGSVVPPGWDDVSIVERTSLRRPQHWRNGRLEVYRGRFFDDIVRARSVRWLGQAPRSAPVFSVVSPFAPHRHPQRCGRGGSLTCELTPAVMPRDRGARACRGVGRFKPPSYTVSTRNDPTPTRVPAAWRRGWPLRRACESLLVVDRTVRQLERAQRRRGRPAYWVLLSDNGMAWGRHGFPLKHVPWSTQLPLYVSGPGIEPGRTRAAVSIIDVPVTLAELAGAEMPWADGRSLTPILDGRTTTHRDEILEHMPAPPDNGLWGYRAWQGLRTPEWRYVRWADGERELYDLMADRAETRNVAGRNPAVVAMLDERLDAALAASAMTTDAVPSPAPEA